MQPVITFLTYLEPYTGVYDGQVIDVCAFLEEEFKVDVRLIALLSPRQLRDSAEKLKQRWPKTEILSVPLGWRGWSISSAITRLQIANAIPKRCRAVICRGPIATSLALDIRANGRIEKVIYDGRGAIAAEWEEYLVAPNIAWMRRILEIERRAVHDSNFRIAVTNELVSHWENAFDYCGNAVTVIPCTLSRHHTCQAPDPLSRKARRQQIGLTDDATVVCYSGSAAEWQSIRSADNWLARMMANDDRLVLLFMSQIDMQDMKVRKQNPDRVRQVWVSPDEVVSYLQAADYGLLIREPTTTNRVAAPTKFAEYLAAGLRILISVGVGDYSKLTIEHDLGLICDTEAEPPFLPAVCDASRQRLMDYSARNFSKKSLLANYRAVLQATDI